MKRRTLFTGMTAVFATLLMAGPVLASTTVSGHAYGESVDVTTLALVHVTSGPLPSTGELPATGGDLTNSAATACVGVALGCEILSTGALTVHTVGTTGPTGSVTSTASVVNVNALAGLVTGAVVASQCNVTAAGATSGSSTLTTVVVNGVPVAVNPGPNTVIILAGIGTVTLNEQIYDSTTNTLTVNAIHIRLTGGTLGTGDIIIAQSQCDSSPAGPPPVIPESPLAILLPLMMVAIVGGAVFISRRRNQVSVS